MSFPAQADQYVRVVLTTGVTTNWWSIDEFYLYTGASRTTTTTVAMASSQTVDDLEMTAPDYPGDYARGYDVEVSGNGTSWTPVVSCTGTANPEIVSFAAQTDQYLEVVLTTASATNWWSIEQFKVY